MINVKKRLYGNLWSDKTKLFMKVIIESLVDEANRQGLSVITRKDGSVGKYTKIGTLNINLRKYSLEIGDATINYYRIRTFDIQNSLLLVETEYSSMAFQL